MICIAYNIYTVSMEHESCIVCVCVCVDTHVGIVQRRGVSGSNEKEGRADYLRGNKGKGAERERVEIKVDHLCHHK